MENMISKELYQRLIDNMNIYLNKKDDYDEPRLYKVSKKVRYVLEAASTLGLDPVVPTGIIIGEELTKTAYGAVGEEYIKSIYPGFDRVDFAKRMMNGLLDGIDSPEKEDIIEGIEHIGDRGDKTPEEKLAYMFIDGFEYSDSFDTKTKRDYCFASYKNRIKSYSLKTGELAGPVIPKNNNPRPKKRSINREHALKVLKEAHKYYKDNKSLIPEGIMKGFGDLDEDALIGCFIVALPEEELERVTGIREDNTNDNRDYTIID